MKSDIKDSETIWRIRDCPLVVQIKENEMKDNRQISDRQKERIKCIREKDRQKEKK